MAEIKIKSIQKKHYKGYVYNLAVKGDETFYANDVLVHNCRSVMSPIFIEETSQPESYYYNWENRKDMPVWGSRSNRNIDGKYFDMNKPTIRIPNKGFGG